MDTSLMTPKHWIVIILALLFFNIICYGCVLLVYGVGA